MKAYVYGAAGPAIADVAKPSPKGTQVLVKVHACGLNRADLGVRSGEHTSLHAIGQLQRFKDGPPEQQEHWVKRYRLEWRYRR